MENQLNREELSISRISKELVLDRRTAKKHKSITESNHKQILQKQLEFKDKQDPYKGYEKFRLTKYPETSSAEWRDILNLKEGIP